MATSGTVYVCPADAAADETHKRAEDRTCGRTFTSLNGAVSHAVNKPADDGHHTHESRVAAADSLGESLARGPTDGAPPADDGPTPGDARDPEIPEADRGPEDTADCPNCGHDLEHTEAEIEQFIEEHGSAVCGACGATIIVEEEP